MDFDEGPEANHPIRSGKLNKKGVTIIELLIYIALFAIISLLVGRQFNSLINNYSSGKRITSQQTDTRDILGLMVREIRNTGLKVYFTGGASLTKNVKDKIIVTIGTDSSSFMHGNQKSGTYNDTLRFLKIRLDNSSNYKYTDTIRYYVTGTTLWRELRTTETPNYTNSVVAENVYALQFRYGVLAANDAVEPAFDLLPLVSPSSSTWGYSGTAPTFPSNTIQLAPASAVTGHYVYCSTSFKVYVNRKYLVTMLIDPSGNFPANLSSMEISFRGSNHTTMYGSETFKPYAVGDTMRITVPVTSDAAQAYAHLAYTTTSGGTLVIKGIEVRCSELGAYSWKDNPTAAEKRNVRAIKVLVLTRSSEKAGTKVSTNIAVADVSVPRSGEYTWRLFTETIETPNNGVF